MESSWICLCKGITFCGADFVEVDGNTRFILKGKEGNCNNYLFLPPPHLDLNKWVGDGL